ncbi:MAG TPA: uroporphyrinogen-III synthase [Longimicrobiales bacterium]|nr:uroporphyrinogen-III synthase [Longimicrobiales bacterium]
MAVTRPWQADDPLAGLLQAEGAAPVVVPLVRIAPVDDRTELIAAAGRLEEYDWIVFTSANAVRMMAPLVAARAGGSGKAMPHVAVVGPATAAAVGEMLGWETDAMPPRYTGAVLADAMAAVRPLRGARVLWPRAADAREALPGDLSAAGAIVDAPVTYHTLEDRAGARRLCAMMARGEIDVVTLTSPSAATCLAGTDPQTEGVVIAAIGPSTAEAAMDAGLPVHLVAERHTIPGLVDALRAYLARNT